MVPVQKSKKKHVGFSCIGGDVEFTVSLNHIYRLLYLPLTVSVVNGSSRRIKMRAIIQRHCFYYAQGNNNYDKRELAAVNTRNIAPHSEQTMVIEDLVVPAGVEPSFSESQIIKMQYVLKVIAVIPWAKNFFVAIPITLGNVPFTDTEHT